MTNKRIGSVERTTKETSVSVALNLDGVGTADIKTGIGFFDHMLSLLSAHGMMDIQVACKGDLEVDGHHTVEDVGITLGQAFAQALGNKEKIVRYGSFLLPMDEALVQVALDLSGRPYLAYNASIAPQILGEFDTGLCEEFFRAFSQAAGITLHITVLDGRNAHHMIEAMFKGLGRALDAAKTKDERIRGVPSTKGLL